MAYYRAGWENDVKHLLEAHPDSGNFWITVNGNSLDMCVLEWCKLFGGKKRSNNSLQQILKDPEAFKADVLQHLALDEAVFEEEVQIFRTYRDRWIAHLDRDRKGFYPRLENAKKAVWFYYEYIGKEQIDQKMGTKRIETGYAECLGSRKYIGKRPRSTVQKLMSADETTFEQYRESLKQEATLQRIAKATGHRAALWVGPACITVVAVKRSGIFNRQLGSFSQNSHIRRTFHKLQ